jgi:hypothetical protein
VVVASAIVEAMHSAVVVRQLVLKLKVIIDSKEWFGNDTLRSAST